MRPIFRFWLPALAALAGLTTSAQADVIVNVPFVSVRVGSGGVCVRAPFVRVQVPRTIVVAPYPGPSNVAPPIEVAPPPRPERIGDPIPVPLPKPGQTDFSVPVPLSKTATSRPQTHREFADTFKPAAGTYDVVLVHPMTHQPVQVTFTLPEGQARNVRSLPRQIQINYPGRSDVTIRFLADGRVQVTN